MLQRIVRDAVSPHPPDHPHPRPAQDADGVRVVTAASARPEVSVFCPWIMLAAGVSQGRQGISQAFVAGSAESGHLTLARLLRYGTHPRIGGQRLGARVALASVTDLGEELGGGERRARITEEREEDLSVGMGSHGAGDPRVEHPDLLDEGLEGGNQRKHGGPARLFLGLLCPPLGRETQPGEQLCGGFPSAIAMAGEEAGEALLAQPPGVCGTRIALEKSQSDGRSDLAEDAVGARPESLQFGVKTVGQRDPGSYEVFAGAGENPQSLRLVRVGSENPEAVVIGAGELGQAEGVEGVGLPASGPEARAGGFQLLSAGWGGSGAPRGQLPANAPPKHRPSARSRRALHPVRRASHTARREVSLIMGDPPLHEGTAVSLEHAHLMDLFGPVYSRTPILHHYPPSPAYTCSGESDRELPLRVARRSALGGAGATPCCRLLAAPHRREAPSNRGPLVYGASGLGALPAVVGLSPHRPSLEQITPPPKTTSLSGRRSTDRLPYERSGLLRGRGAILLQPSLMARRSQAILSPLLLGVIQDMCLDDTHKGREVFSEDEMRRPIP